MLHWGSPAGSGVQVVNPILSGHPRPPGRAIAESQGHSHTCLCLSLRWGIRNTVSKAQMKVQSAHGHPQSGIVFPQLLSLPTGAGLWQL